MRDEPAEIGPLTGSDSKPAPHPPSGGASGTFPLAAADVSDNNKASGLPL